MEQDKIPYYKWAYGKFILEGYITNTNTNNKWD